MSDHALLAPSAAGRWIPCPGSAIYETQFPDEPHEIADEGTALHEVTAGCLLSGDDPDIYFDAEIHSGTRSFTMTEERLDLVRQELEFVHSIYDPTYTLYVEKKLKAPFIKQSGGTADVIIFKPNGMLHIIDHKYGYVPVSADSEQLKLYGAMAIAKHRKRGCTAITLHVGQPRVNNYVSHVVSLREMDDWVANTLQPAAEAALSDDPPRIAGDHCKYCKAAPECPERRAESLAIFDEVDTAPQKLTRDEMGDLLDKFPAVEAWMKSVRKAAYALGMDKQPPTGYKIVHSATRRKWVDEELAQILLGRILDKNDLYSEPKFLTVAQAEKLLDTGSKKILAKYWEKPVAYTLVPESDKRKSISQALDDFKNITYNE